MLNLLRFPIYSIIGNFQSIVSGQEFLQKVSDNRDIVKRIDILCVLNIFFKFAKSILQMWLLRMHKIAKICVVLKLSTRISHHRGSE